MILDTREERINLLKSGISAKEVEALYIDLNNFETLQINWDGSATNRTGRILIIPSFKNLSSKLSISVDSVRVQAASSHGVRA